MEQIPRDTQPFGAVERNSIITCCALSLFLFFFPLLTIHMPIAGDQDVSGYDVFSKVSEFRDKLQPSDTRSTSTPHIRNPGTLVPDLPLSIRLAWLMPLALILAFVSAAVALIAAFKNPKAARVVCIIGACFSAAAILHTTIMNSDLHSWLADSMKTAPSEKHNPFAGLAENFGTLIVNAFQIKPGWGVYALVVLLSLAAALGFSRALSRLLGRYTGR
jgi:hypothetical protein